MDPLSSISGSTNLHCTASAKQEYYYPLPAVSTSCEGAVTQIADSDTSGVLASKHVMAGLEENTRRETFNKTQQSTVKYKKSEDLVEMIESLVTVPLDVLFGVDPSLCTWWTTPSYNDSATPVDGGDAEVDALLLG